MKTKYNIELANNGMIIRRKDYGDDMLESPDVQDEIKNLMQQTDDDGINDFEIIVEIKPKKSNKL